MSENEHPAPTGGGDPQQGPDAPAADRQPTTPQPAHGSSPSYGSYASPQPYGQHQPYVPQQPYGQQPYAPPQPYGQSRADQGQPGGTPYWGPPRQPTTPVPPFPGTPGGSETSAPSGRSGRLRIGIAGLVAGALIGGGAGAGVATLVDDGAGGGGSPVATQPVTIENPQTATTATAAAAKAAPSVVTIYVSGSSGSGSGSGVVLTDDGYVLTNDHVVSGGGAVQVRTADGALYDAEVVGTDPSSDIAVLRLAGAEDLTPATFADSDDVQVGDVAVAIGAPLGLSNTVTDGIISATNRAVQTGSSQDEATVIDAIQTDAAINPGNSGGALVDGAGEVIGINTAIATVASGLPGSEAQSGNIGVGFAIPGNTAQRIAEEIIETGEATRAYLGVSATTAATGQNRNVGAGAQIVSVEPGSAAADAGLQEGDVVTAVGDRPVTTSTELTAAVRSLAPGEEVTLTVGGGGSEREVEVTLGSTS